MSSSRKGGEAGGHGGTRATFTLVPEVADLISQANVRPRCSSRQAALPTAVRSRPHSCSARRACCSARASSCKRRGGDTLRGSCSAVILSADGDATVKTMSFDVVRRFDWPEKHHARGLQNRFTQKWHGRESALSETAVISAENENYWKAFHAGDAENAGVLIGENAGLIRDVQRARDIVENIARDAQAIMEKRRALIR
jgi:nitronate monooxygenase